MSNPEPFSKKVEVVSKPQIAFESKASRPS